jgi:predicted CXXCH cytochrome family protein
MAWALLTCLAVMALAASAALAAVSGPCVNCHTMHNSQDGAKMVTTTGDSAIAHLTLNNCVGCHTNGGVGGAPVIDGNYNVDSCAGGTFKDAGTAGQIVASDAGVHNVDIALSVLGEDDTFTTSIPGLTTGMNLGAGSTDPNDLTCAGANGCHGDSTVDDNDAGIAGFHHGGKDGYRYLQIADTHAPVLGKGAADWEVAMSDGWVTGEEHNVYSSSTTAGINKLCANCHPDFHGTANTWDGNNWIRHPTDNAIPTTNGWSATVDYRDNPFAFADVSALDTTGTYTTANAQVACISCHRAHGTPYDDILRWDYSAQSAGSALTAGCLGCHNKQRGP